MPRTLQTVCIIDDDESVRRALRRLIRSVGMDVETFATAEEFLQFLRAQLGDGLGLAIACISPDVIEPALERQGLGNCRIEVVSGVLAPSIGQLGYAKAIRGDVVDALHLDANYIRRPDAEMNWKGG